MKTTTTHTTTEISLETVKAALLTSVFYLTKDRTEADSYQLEKKDIDSIAIQLGGDRTLCLLKDKSTVLGRLGKENMLKICSKPNAYKILNAFLDNHAKLILIYPPKRYIALFTCKNVFSVIGALTSTAPEMSRTIQKLQDLKKSDKNDPTLQSILTIVEKISDKDVDEDEDMDALLIHFLKHYAFFLDIFDEEQIMQVFTRSNAESIVHTLIKHKAVMRKIPKENNDLHYIAMRGARVDKNASSNKKAPPVKKPRANKKANSAINTLDALGERYESLSDKIGVSAVMRIARKNDSAEVLNQMDINYNQLCACFPNKQDIKKLSPSSGQAIKYLIEYYPKLTGTAHMNLTTEQLIEFVNEHSSAKTMVKLFESHPTFKKPTYQVLKQKGYQSNELKDVIKRGFDLISFLLENDFTDLKDAEGNSFKPHHLAKLIKYGLAGLSVVRSEVTRLTSEFNLTIDEIFSLANRWTKTGDQHAILVLLSNYTALKEKAFTHEQILTIVKTIRPLQTITAILREHAVLSGLGYSHEDIVSLIIREEGPERIRILIEQTDALLDFDVKQRISAVKNLGEEGIKHFREKSNQLKALNFDEPQIKNISCHRGSVKTIDLIIQKFSVLTRELNFSMDDIATMASWNDASVALTLIIKKYTRLTGKSKKDFGLTNSEIVAMASHHHAGATIETFMSVYDSLMTKGWTRKDILFVASQRRSGGGALQAADDKYDTFMTLKDRNKVAFTQEQLVIMMGYNASPLTLQYLINNHPKLIDLKDKQGCYLTTQQIAEIASNHNALQSLEILVEQHAAIMSLQDQEKNAITTQQIHAVLRHRIGYIAMDCIIKNHTRFTTSEESGGMSFSHKELFLIADRYNSGEELNALLKYYDDLKAKGYCKEQMLALSNKHGLAHKTIVCVAARHNELIRIMDRNGDQLIADDIFKMSNYCNAFLTLEFILVNHAQLTRSSADNGMNCLIQDIVSIAAPGVRGHRNLQVFMTYYAPLSAKGCMHDEIVAMSSKIQGYLTLKTVLEHYDTLIKPRHQGGLGFTHAQVMALSTRDWGGWFLVRLIKYLSDHPDFFDRYSSEEITRTIVDQQKLRAQQTRVDATENNFYDVGNDFDVSDNVSYVSEVSQMPEKGFFDFLCGLSQEMTTLEEQEMRHSMEEDVQHNEEEVVDELDEPDMEDDVSPARNKRSADSSSSESAQTKRQKTDKAHRDELSDDQDDSDVEAEMMISRQNNNKRVRDASEGDLDEPKRQKSAYGQGRFFPLNADAKKSQTKLTETPPMPKSVSNKTGSTVRQPGRG